MEHPITPPPELVDNWLAHAPNPLDRLQHVATQAARWGADQELEACCECLELEERIDYAALLRSSRRPKPPSPKPPSLKQQALEALNKELGDMSIVNYNTIRSVLESLPDPQD